MKAATPPVPVDDPAGMLVWYSRLPPGTQMKMGAKFRQKLTEVRSQLGGGGGGAPTDPLYTEFEKLTPRRPDSTLLGSLKRLQDFALFKIDRGQRTNNFAEVQEATKSLVHYSSIIHDEEMRAQKLGKASGETLSRTDHESVISAQAFWTMRCVDAALDGLSRRLLNLGSPEKVRAVLEPFLLSTRFFEPFVHASLTSAANALPSWFVDHYILAVENYIENGGQLARAEIKGPVLKPPGGVTK